MSKTTWKDVRDTIDLSEVATRLLGPSEGRQGDRSNRLWWRCPLHEDRNPSFCVKPGSRQWHCFGCGEKGDVIDLAQHLNPGMTFPEAVAYLTGGQPRGPAPARKTSPARETGPGGTRPGPRASEDWRRWAGSVVSDASERLWGHEGADSLAYLRGRGLSDEAIRQARLGSSLGGDGVPRGITVPWWGDGPDLSMVQIRRPDGSKPKYQALKGSKRGGLYPGPASVLPGKPLIIAEGEFDALLLGQELDGLAGVVTLGSASSRPTPDVFMKMLAGWPWIVATDNDPAGQSASEGWPAPVQRVRPPGAYKDWTEAFQGRVDLRRWWSDVLAGDEPPLFTWNELASWRWGPALDGPEPNIIIDRPDLERMLSALQAASGDDPEARAEREAVMAETS